jgi:hypothetical protein
MKKSIVLFTMVLMLLSNAHGQKEIIDFLKAGVEDANTLGNAYLKPYGEMLGVNLNSGWYNSAKVHKLGGFDLMVSASYTTVPNAGKSFDANDIGLKNISASGDGITPTMAGSGSKGQSFHFNEDPLQTDILTIKGSDLSYYVSPMIQGAVGLPFDTEIMGRFMPQTSLGDYGQVYLWGLGVKHSLKDYIPFVKRLPFLQLSVLGAYTSFNSSLGVEYLGQDGKFEIGAGAYTGRVLVGANLPVVAFYTGMGYGSTSSNFDVKGEFDGIPGETEAYTDPIALKYSTSGFDFNVGMRIRLAIFAIYADYTVGDYSVITAGVGINFR